MWDERFGTEEYAYGKEPNDFLVEAVAIGKLTGGKALSLAEGEGRNGVYLAEKGFHVTAVDSSAVGLNKARKLASERNVRIKTIQADLSEYEITPDYWDVITSIFCHLPPEMRKDIHRQVVAGLSDGGIYILEGYSKDQLKYKTGGPKTPELLFGLKTIISELAGLEFLHGVEFVREIREGGYHTGPGAVVQVVARKAGPA